MGPTYRTSCTRTSTEIRRTTTVPGPRDYTDTVQSCASGSREYLVKKGRHRRFEEARSLKRAREPIEKRCPECGAGPEDEHASWCLAEEMEDEEGDATVPRW
jgi:hypothetical protein